MVIGRATIFLATLAAGCAPLSAAVAIQSMAPSAASPQPLGTQIAWTVAATDSNPNFLTFQFNVAAAGQPYTMVRDFNIGELTGLGWKAPAFTWTTIAGEGSYNIQVVAKDFISGESASQTVAFTLLPRAHLQSVINKVKNPLVALFSAPPCAAGSTMRVAFYTASNAPGYTNWAPCNPPVTMNFYVAGMLPSTTYTMYSQTQTAGKFTNGGKLLFTTGSLPTNLGKTDGIPTFKVNVPAGSKSDTTDSMLLWAFEGNVMPVATDLNGNIMWYYGGGAATVLTRVLPGANILTIQDGASWDSTNITLQMIRQIDLAGNIVRETNAGVVSQQLVAMGATDAGSCLDVPNPAPVGAACLNDFDHEATTFTAGGNTYTAVLARIEKVFPPGTQGSDPNGPPLDILADMVIVLNAQWQVVWYFDTFEQLDINRPAVLGEVAAQGENCAPGENCFLTLLLASSANDWTHANTIQYVPASGALLVSLRNQDWVIEVNYNNGAGPGNILWRMGVDGDFTIVAPQTDPWPWFSHQHDAGYASTGANLLTVFDNGNTRVSPSPLGLGQGASRGMALSVDFTNMQVTPVISVGLGVFAPVYGSAQLLSDGLYLFQAGSPDAYAIEILPTPGYLIGTQELNVFSPHGSYRAWQMPNLYAPPLW
jgi:arylsulfate sulfotransferase